MVLCDGFRPSSSFSTAHVSSVACSLGSRLDRCMGISFHDHAALAAATLVLSCVLSPTTPLAGQPLDPEVDQASSIVTESARSGHAAVAGLAPHRVSTAGALSAPSSQARWQWPVSGSPQLQARFDAPAHRYGAGHRGIDISGGAPHIHAVEDGVVHFAGSVAGKPVVSIRHHDGLLSTYEPVVARVSRGDRVSAGQEIGTLQENSPHSHCPGACLHLGARMDDRYLDPLPLLGMRGPSVLYPRT